MSKRLISAQDAARRCGVTEGTIYHWRDRGYITLIIKDGKQRYLESEVLEAWKKAQD